jgi:hypothetical protein
VARLNASSRAKRSSATAGGGENRRRDAGHAHLHSDVEGVATRLLVEQVRAIDVGRLGKLVGHVTPNALRTSGSVCQPRSRERGRALFRTSVRA